MFVRTVCVVILIVYQLISEVDLLGRRLLVKQVAVYRLWCFVY